MTFNCTQCADHQSKLLAANTIAYKEFNEFKWNSLQSLASRQIHCDAFV